MRLFAISDDGAFTEYAEQDFKIEHQERILEDWLVANPDAILHTEKLLVIGRQVTTNLKTFIDILAIDRQGNTVVVELKRDRTPRGTLAQALEYASFAEDLSYDQLDELWHGYSGEEGQLADYHLRFFGLEEGEAVSFNKDQRIVIIGHGVTPEIRQTASFLRRKGQEVICVEFSFFQTGSGERLLSSDVVVGKEMLRPKEIHTASLPKTDEGQFMAALDHAGRPVFEAILRLAKERGLPLHWGSKGFSLNVDLDGQHVAVCFGYPPESVYKQSIYTAFGEVRKKVAGAEALIAEYRERFEKVGRPIPAGKELKWVITSPPEEGEIESLIRILSELATAVSEKGLADRP